MVSCVVGHSLGLKSKQGTLLLCLLSFFHLPLHFHYSAPQIIIQDPIKRELDLQCKALTHGPMYTYSPGSQVVARRENQRVKLYNSSDFTPSSPRRKAVIKTESVLPESFSERGLKKSFLCRNNKQLISIALPP